MPKTVAKGVKKPSIKPRFNKLTLFRPHKV